MRKSEGIDTHVRALAADFGGTLVTPDDAAYDEARKLFNAMIDRRPAVIAQCTSVEDVVLSLRFARERGLPVAVRGGGHSVAGNSLVDDGVVIDLRRMNEVRVDAAARTATAQGGATMRDLDRATGSCGLATVGGRVSTTGVAGFALGGGSGWLERKFGLACDNLLAAELVTADGRLVRASDDDDPELLWALRGGGGNFGVATSLTFRVHPLAKVTLARLIWAPAEAPRVLRAWRDHMEAAPDDLGGAAHFVTGGDAPFVPAELAGKLAIELVVTYAGVGAEASEALMPLLALRPQGYMVAELPYEELQHRLDDPPGYRNYWSAEYLEGLPDEAIDAFCARAADMLVPSPSQPVIIPQGGAVSRDAPDTPIGFRDSMWVVHPFGLWEDPEDDARVIQWARDMRADLRPWTTGAVYLNFIGDEGEDRVVAGFGRENYERLAAVKSRLDPDNVFRNNHNIRPRPAAAAPAELLDEPAVK